MLNELAERVRTLEALVASSRARKEFSPLDKDCAMEIVRLIYNDLLSTTCFSEEEEPEIEVSLYGEIDGEQIEAELDHFIASVPTEPWKEQENNQSDSTSETASTEEAFDTPAATETAFYATTTANTEPEIEVNPEEEIEAEPEPEIDADLEPEEYVIEKEDEYLPEMEEQVVYINNDDDFDASYFELNLSDEEFNVIREELCEGDEVECRALVRKLNNFNDFDEAILYIQENYSEYNGQALEILAEKLTDKLV